MKNEFMVKDFDMSKEFWRPFLYKGRFHTTVEVSNFGRVRTIGSLLNRKQQFGQSAHLVVEVSIIQGTDDLGRLVVGKAKNIPVHRLVAETFADYLKLPNDVDSIYDEDLVIHHINGVSIDNQLTNLRVMHKSDHSRLHKEVDSDIDGYIKSSIVSEELVEEICLDAAKNKPTMKELSDKYNVTVNVIYGILSGRNHQFISQKYDLSHYQKDIDRTIFMEDLVRLIKVKVSRRGIINYLVNKYDLPRKYISTQVDVVREKIIGAMSGVILEDQKEKYGQIHAKIEKELLYNIRTNEAWSALIDKIQEEEGLRIGVTRDLVKQRAAAIYRRSITVKIPLPPIDDPVFISFCEFIDSRRPENHVYKYESIDPLIRKLLLDGEPLFDIKMMLMKEHGLTKNQASNIVSKIKRNMVQQGILVGKKYEKKKLKEERKKVVESIDSKLLNSFHMEIEEHLLDSDIRTWDQLLEYIHELSETRSFSYKQAYALVTYLLKRIIAPKPSCIVSLYGRGPEVERLRQMYRAHENRKGGKFGEYYEIVDNLLRSGWSYIQIQPILKRMNPDLTPHQMQGIVRNRKKAMESKKVA